MRPRTVAVSPYSTDVILVTEDDAENVTADLQRAPGALETDGRATEAGAW